MIARAFVVCTLLALGWPASVSGDEFRMKDGRIFIGSVAGDEGPRLRVRVAAAKFRKMRTVTLRAEDVQERLRDVKPAAEALDALLGLIEEGSDTLNFKWRARLRTAERLWEQRADTWIHPFLRRVGERSPEQLPAYFDDTPLFPPWPGTRWAKPAPPAARAALDWLAAHQDEDGRIDADGFMKHDPDDDKTDGAGGGHHGARVPCAFDGAVTGLAMLGWMASGSTPLSGPYREAIQRGLPYCRQVVERGGVGFDQIWNHAFCLQALAEAYWLGRDIELRPVLLGGVKDLLATQHPDGGWRYIPRAAPGVPSSAAAGTALGMCRRVGIPVPAEALEKLLAYFAARLDAQTGRSEYHDKAERLGYTPTRSNTAAALAATAFLRPAWKPKHLGKQLGAITKHPPTWKLSFKEVKTKDGRTVRAQIGYLYPYAWYYTDLALHLHGNKGKPWRAKLCNVLVAAQRKDGAAQGSWDPKGTYSDSGGRAFVTALGALMLLSPARYKAR